MPMYNLLEYSDNYSIMSGSLWNYYRDDMNDATIEDAANYRVINNKATASQSFEYKKKVIESTPANNNKLNTEVVVHIWIIFGELLIYLWLTGKYSLIYQGRKIV